MSIEKKRRKCVSGCQKLICGVEFTSRRGGRWEGREVKRKGGGRERRARLS
jgi:hypothetical protein